MAIFHARLSAIGYFALLMLALKVVYILVEVTYNHTLLEFIGSYYLTESQVENIELFGRNLAAIGLVLLLLPFFVKSTFRPGWRKAASYPLVLLLIAGVYFSTYKGQEWVIEYYAEQSSPESRYDAYYLNMLRGLLARGDIVSSQLLPEQGQNNLMTFEDKLSLLAMPIALSGEKDIIATLQSSGILASARFLRDDAAHSRFAADWEAYASLHGTLLAMWESYQDVMISVETEIASSERTATHLLRTAYKAIDSGYMDYEKASNSLDLNIRQRLTEDNISQLHQGLRIYFSSAQPEKADAYRAATWTLFRGAATEDQSRRWCSNSGKSCPGSRQHVHNEAKKIYGEVFRASLNGLPPGLGRESYMKHPIMERRVVEQIIDQGFLYPAGSLIDYPTLAAAVRKTVFAQALNEWHDVWFDSSATLIPIGLTLSQFLTHDAIQSKLPSEVRGHSLTMDVQEFFTEIWAPAAESQIQTLQSKVTPDSPASFQSEPWLEVGVKSIKLTYILPLAMSLSAIFSLLNGLVVVLTVMGWGYLLVKGKQLPQAVIPAALAALLITIPFITSTSVNQEHPGIQQAITWASAQGLLSTAGVHWLIGAENVIYHTGDVVVRSYPDSLQGNLTALFGGAALVIK